MRLDRFYPIFDHSDWLRRMLPLGVKLVQLRIKDQPLDVVREQIVLSRDLCREHGAVLVINDYWQEAIDAGCDWLHLGQEDLDEADLKADKDGNTRSPYSLRHYALQTRLRKSEGKVNIYWLAENAGTSVEQLERFYLKRMEPTGEKVRNIQSFGD